MTEQAGKRRVSIQMMMAELLLPAAGWQLVTVLAALLALSAQKSSLLD